MKIRHYVFAIASFAPLGTAFAVGFLNPNATFPKAEADLGLGDKIALRAEGYMPFEELSAYQQLQVIEADYELQSDLEAYEATQAQNSSLPQASTPVSQNSLPNTDVSVQGPTVTFPTFGQEQQAQSNNYNGGGYCATQSPSIQAGQTVPFGNPTTISVANGFCSKYGWRDMGAKELDPHYGVDIGCGKKYFGTPIYATADGVVVTAMDAQQCKSMGNYVKIRHDSGFVTMYMHLDQFFVTEGQRVTAGCQIGTLGYSGGAKIQKCPKMDIGISHLHYQIAYNGNATSVTAPNGKVLSIRHSPLKKSPKTSIDPTEFVKYGSQ